MKLLTFRVPPGRRNRFGVMLAGERVLDLTAVRPREGIPPDLMTCVARGAKALDAIRAVVEVVESGEARRTSYGLDQISFLPPLLPGKILAVGRNYGEHAAETGSATYSRPSGFVKLTSCLTA